MGVSDRVQSFLDSWAKVKEQLEELTETRATVALPEEEGE